MWCFFGSERESLSGDVVGKPPYLGMFVMIAPQRYVTRNGAISCPTWKKKKDATAPLSPSLMSVKGTSGHAKVSLKSHWLAKRDDSPLSHRFTITLVKSAN